MVILLELKDNFIDLRKVAHAMCKSSTFMLNLQIRHSPTRNISYILGCCMFFDARNYFDLKK